MKSIEIYVFDFTKGNWQDDGNRLLLDGEGISDGYFDEHVEGEEVVKPGLAVYIPDSYDGNHLVSNQTLEGWLYDKDNCNDYHWYECASVFIDHCTTEWMIEHLDGQAFATVEVSFDQLGYIDYQNDGDIQAELDDMRSRTDNFAYDTLAVTEAEERAKKQSA